MRLPSKKSKIFFISALMATSLSSLVWVWSFQDTASFELDKIRPTRDFCLQKTKTISQEEIANLTKIVSQPFTFLAEDEEGFVFESEDKQYVIHFFNMRKITPKYWLNYIPVPFLDKKRLNKISDRERSRHEIFTSLKNSYEHFRYQTGLVFLHLFRTKYLKTKVHVIDKDGKNHKIPLDLVPFVLQKKALLLGEYIPSLVSRGREEEAVHALCRVLIIAREECRKGFCGRNKAVETDFGFIAGRPVRITAHSLKADVSFKEGENTLREVFRLSQALEAWIQIACPSISTAFQEEAQSLLSFLEEE